MGHCQAHSLAPYALALPFQVVGGTPFRATARVMGASQTGTSVMVDGLMENDVIPAGTWMGFGGVNGTYVVIANATANASGQATLTLDQPIIQSPADNAVVTAGDGLSVPYHLIERPRASFGPTGLVNHDGPFIFAEVLT